MKITIKPFKDYFQKFGEPNINIKEFKKKYKNIRCDNINRLNEYKQQTTTNLQLYSCARSQHAIRVNWLNIITPPSLISAYPSSPFNRVFI